MVRTKNKKSNSNDMSAASNNPEQVSELQMQNHHSNIHNEVNRTETFSEPYPEQGRTADDDFFIDESLIRLLQILLPRLKYIAAFSLLLALGVAVKLYFFTPRTYSCTAVIAPDVMPDLTAVNLVQMTAGTEGGSLPIANQLSQLKALAESSQIKKEIIKQTELMGLWECRDELDCLQKLGGVYSVQEVRQVGLKVAAKTEDADLSFSIVSVGIDKTNSYFKDLLKLRAKESSAQIQSWVNDVTQQIALISDEYIRFASENNVTDLENQFSAGTALLASIKQSIVEKESELIQKQQELNNSSLLLLPLQESIKELREKLKSLVAGKDEDKIYPALSNYEALRMKVQDYQQQLTLLRLRLELFNKQLATAQIEEQKQSRSVMVWDEPLVTPEGKGTVKFFVLTFIATFFFACIFILMLEYWKTIRDLMKSKL